MIVNVAGKGRTHNASAKSTIIKKKEVIQPQVPLRLPCDDLAHLTELRFALPNKARLI